ncbi:MAG: hypothetical protein JWP02_3027 [Acidimicrobiales bacterium]|nr:hypothetical protein [Acidimicrobiales bacterium]
MTLLLAPPAARATAPGSTPPIAAVGVDASRPVGSVNPNLVGFAFQPGVASPAFAPLASRTFRLDVGFQDIVDCPRTTLRADRLAALQQKLDTIESAGAETILILTYMPPCMADTYPGDPRDPTKVPPRDPAAWQRVVTDLVTATGPGRVAGGHRAVRYYEVWNEPDWFFFEDVQPRFISNVMLPAGKAVAAVAAANPGLNLRFGLCGCLFADPGWMVPLMAAARNANLPVGFLSWHYYGNYPFIGPDGVEPQFPRQVAPVVALDGQRNPAANPQSYLLQLDQVRVWAQATLARVPELMIDEWNLSAGGFDKRMDTNEGAAFQAATLAALSSDNLDRAALFSAVDPYDNDIDGHTLPARYGGWGVLDRGLTRKPAWYAQWLWTRLAGQRLASPQDPAAGVWTAASADAGRVDVLVSSFLAAGASDHTLHLTVAGLDPAAWTARLFRVDAGHPGSTDPAETVDVVAGTDGRAVVDTALPAQAVVLAELTRAPAG